jgi:hypothetical protein
MLQLRDIGNPLRLCTPIQAKALLLRIFGRKCISVVNMSNVGTITEINRKSGAMNISDIAQEMQLSGDKVKRLISIARELVRAALRENAKINEQYNKKGVSNC